MVMDKSAQFYSNIERVGGESMVDGVIRVKLKENEIKEEGSLLTSQRNPLNIQSPPNENPYSSQHIKTMKNNESQGQGVI